MWKKKYCNDKCEKEYLDELSINMQQLRESERPAMSNRQEFVSENK